jgi:uncharacterized nucleotidyltransferase DUF6036
MSLFEPVFVALNAVEARYVVVGGLATVLHGYARLTADIDMIVDLDPPELEKTLEAMSALGLRPRAPVDPLAFADAEVRRNWIEEKGMTVFSFWDPQVPMREVDLFVEHPIPFAELWQRSELVHLDVTAVRIASISDLIALKRLAGRPEDLQDIEALEAIALQRPK